MSASRIRPLNALSPAVVVGAVLALVVAVLVAPNPARAAEPERQVVLVGSLQSELGCAADWDPACAATQLHRVGDGPLYSGRFTLPAGTFEYKVAIGGGWDENYGAGGVLGGANIPLAVAGSVQLKVRYDDESHQVTVKPLDLPSDRVTRDDKRRAGDSLRDDLTRERFYFVMTDRFQNATTSNDLGGYADAATAGLDPTHKGYYHGGDLRGLISKIDYIKQLGTTAIWLTPSFKNKPVQDNNGFPSSGYHGYWITDFTQIDPHLGTNAELKELITKAHKRGMKVFFDIITNHTADVIDYTENQYSYIPVADEPWRTADGTPFNPYDYAGTGSFPTLDPDVSFPYHPFVPAAEADVKVPAWLNDVTLYHNRGNSTFAGESSEWGDFAGLDDLMTENQTVVDGMEDIYNAWVDFGVDGFRIDTVKHVNMEFWQEFIPAIRAEASNVGNDDFFAFGEVFDADPRFTSRYDTEGTLQATLDFGFQAAAQAFATGKETTRLSDMFSGDDWYTDADGNAYALPTFLGNHDMGRIGFFIRSGVPGADDAEVLKRDQLAQSLMYLMRGQPVNYYGDEQGFVGDGGDQDARQDMFPSQVATYNDDDLIGTDATTADANFDTSHPVYRWIRHLSALRKLHPALADGTQVPRYSSTEAGIFAVSRIDANQPYEYVVALNNATEPKTATFDTSTPYGWFNALLGASGGVRADSEGRVSITVPALSAAVWRSTRLVPKASHAPTLTWTSPQPGGTLNPLPAGTPGGGRVTLRVAVPDAQLAQTTFLWRVAGSSQWTTLGTDDNAPYRVMPDVSDLPLGSLLEIRAVTKDLGGKYSAATTYGFLGEPSGGGGGGPVGPVVQPDFVSVPGDHNSEMGCSADWLPDCAEAQLTLDANDDIWKGTYTLPAGSYAYKAAINNAWDENYGAGGVPNGGNISYTTDGSPVHFYYDHGTHWVVNDTQDPIVTAPGSFQSELGCPADWDPACMRSWLQDPDGDGTYTFRTASIPSGNYEVKVTHGLSWDINYGTGGTQDGANISFVVPADGLVTTFSYVIGTHLLSISTEAAGGGPDLSTSLATQLSPRLFSWPTQALPAGMPAPALRWRLHWGPADSLSVDATAIVGGESAPLRLLPGLPPPYAATYPDLVDDVTLQLSAWDALRLHSSAAGQIVVAAYDDAGTLLAASGAAPPP